MLRIFSIFFMLFLSGCTLLLNSPKHLSQSERMDMIVERGAPLRQQAKIYWDQHSIPFIEAQNDEDAAFLLGLTHAHLRLGQLEMLRFLSQGRLGELAGPWQIVSELDYGLRMLGFRKAAENALENLEPLTRMWLKKFCRGINWYASNLKELPYEYDLFSLSFQPFSELDILTIGKLASADLSWSVYLRFLQLAQKPGWEEVFESFRTSQLGDPASIDNSKFSRIIRDYSKSGSNSLVVSKEKSKSGSAMIASDPHVGLLLPNFWLIAGLKSPSDHVVGLMIPGLPFFALGRSPDIAWGGTNMRGISSHLFDVSELEEVVFERSMQRHKRRWWFDENFSFLESPFGPVLSEWSFAEDFTSKKIAMDWLGQRPSDEIGAFLKASRAKNWQQFRQSFESYYVSAMNILYADRQGNIGMIAAYAQPVLKDTTKTLDLTKDPSNPVVSIRKSTELSSSFNPKQDYIASANNKPFSTQDIPIAYSYAPANRYERIRDWMKVREKLGVSELKSLQLDVFSKASFDLKSLLFRRLPISTFQNLSTSEIAFMDSIFKWDGRYTVSSIGAASFERLMSFAWKDYLLEQKFSEAQREFFSSFDDWKPIIHAYLESKNTADLLVMVKNWLQKVLEEDSALRSWGEMNRQLMQHPFGNIPWLGKRFQYEEYPEAGSVDTLNKNAHPLSDGSHRITYGASARHISDMSDMDANFFVLKGGQDGWLSNEQLFDQVELWKMKDYIRIPLRLEAVQSQFNTHVSIFTPN